MRIRNFNSFFITLFMVACCATASAQQRKDLAVGSTQPEVSSADAARLEALKSDAAEPKQISERKRIRQERNYIESSGGLMGSLTSLSDSWVETSGGDDAVSLLATLSFKHIFTKDKFSVQTRFTTKFGYYRVTLEEKLPTGGVDRSAVWYKNQDELFLEVTPSYKFSKNWSYGASAKFRSQYAPGYVSSASQEDYNLKSDFMSPGYFDLSGGLIYTSPAKKWPFVVSLSPIAMSATYVTNATIRNNAQYEYKSQEGATPKYTSVYGVNPSRSSYYEGGSSIQVDFERYFDKKNIIKYKTTLYSFYGWMTQISHGNVYHDIAEFNEAKENWSSSSGKMEPMLVIHPTVRWVNQIDIKATKFLSTVLNFQLYYNRAQNLAVQTQTLLSVGLSYKFDSKSYRERAAK